MQQYMTRRLVAAQEMTYCEWPLRPGDEFCATPVDAEYLVRNKRAKEAPAAAVFVEAAPVQQIAEPEAIPVAEAVEIHPESIADEPVRARRPYVRRKAAAE